MEGHQWLGVLSSIITGQLNETHDTSAPILKPIVRNIYPIFMLQYGLLMLVGAAANVLVGYHVMRRKLYRDVTHALLLNLVLSHCVQCFVVVPMTLTVLLVQNWVFGQFLCYFLPMLQVSRVFIPIPRLIQMPATFHSQSLFLPKERKRRRRGCKLCPIKTITGTVEWKIDSHREGERD